MTPATVTATHYATPSGVAYPRVSRILHAARRLPVADLAFAMARGTAVHTALEYLTTNRLDWTTIGWLEPYITSYLRWAQVVLPRTIHTERPVVHPDLAYGGRMDWVGYLPGIKAPADAVWVVDYKTGQPNPVDQLQTAAYWRLYRHATDPTARDPWNSAHTVCRGALYLDPNGAPARFAVHTNPADLAAFLAFRTVYQWEATNYGHTHPTNHQ